MLNRLRNSHSFKVIVVFVAINILSQIVFPTAAFALGGGPSQAEYQSFEPVGTSEMVNLSSGDFTYNIPLLDVDGYPINLSYHSGVSSDQESSWTGLGWNVNPGVLNRGMRGLPDDFNGDVVSKEINMKDKSQYGISISPSLETYGMGITPSMGMGIFYDNYKGLGFEYSAGLGFNAPLGLPLTANLGISANSQEGIDISADVGLSVGVSYKNVSVQAGVTVGANYSSRGGITNVTMNSSADISASTKKRGTASLGFGVSSNVPIGTQSYSPTINVPINSNAYTFSFTAGGEIFGLHPNGTATGWSSTQQLRTKNLSNPAYGYLYAQNGDQNLYGLKDFNREKDGVFHTTMHNLPLTNHTYDLYAANGQGIGGVYRPYRSEVGTVSDPIMYESSSNNAYSGEVGFGNLTHVGFNKNKTAYNNISGPWANVSENPAYGALTYKSLTEVGDELYESAYFKQAGELTTRDDAYYSAIGESNPMQLDLNQSSTNITGGTTLNGSIPITNQIRSNRVQRNQNLSYLTGQEASNFALETSIKSYNGFYYTGYPGYNPNSITPRNTGNRAHHMSEVTVLREDGARYIYGIPAYNNTQRAVTFNIQGGTPNCTTGLVSYTPGTDNSTSNSRGLDNYFEATNTPEYAHSYLLSAIISPDYVDITGDGPSDDDLGNYTKFNYSKMNNYKWRVPVEQNMAIFNVGHKTDDLDDQASYIYGEKEIWYLHSVETKNYVAEFSLSNRRDGVGVTGENGGISSGEKLKKLDKITLFSKRDKITNQAIPANLTPIKVVHFEYDYTLCKDIPNYFSSSDPDNLLHNEGGKLTLKKVYFTYGNSDKGALNPYEFTYADANHNLLADEPALNPNYSLKGYDKWGTYKEQPAGVTCITPGGVLSNDEFPYTNQDATTDTYAAAWLLSTIELPSGGIMNVDYESDDYAYIQDKRAQQMFKVDQASSLPLTSISGNELFASNTIPNNYIRIVLPDPIIAASGPAAQSEFINNYIGLENTSQVYFKFFVNIANGYYDYVSGYADLDLGGIILQESVPTSGSYDLAYLKFKPEYMKDNNSGDPTSPVSKAAFQMVRMYMNNILYPGNAQSSFSFSTFTNIVSNFLTDVKTIVKGVNSAVRSKGVGKYFIPNKSWVRLQNPNGNKKGGGVRVTKITMNDSWNQMVASESASEYGQTYDYKLNNGMSSGVASYEPLTGGDENPFRKPIPYEVDRKFYDNSTMFQEEPYGESLFPSADVVYSKVTVKNLERRDVNDLDSDSDFNELIVNRNATGRTEYEYYTAKDYPIITNRTGMLQKKIKPSFLNNLFSKKHTYKFAATQGYSIELNDMHGKPKAKKSYAEGGTAPVEGIEYYYKSVGNRLNNKVDVITKDNVILSNKTVGEEFDVVMDSRYQQSITNTTNIQTGLDISLYGIFPVPIPSFFMMTSETFREFKSVVSTKVVQRYGVLDRVVVFDQNSKVTTSNKLFDETTGKVLLTETINEFESPLYAFNYPAHWVYEGMEQASKNIGAQIGIITDATGLLTSSTLNLFPGDELYNDTTKIWMIKDESSASDLYAIDEEGNPLGLLNATYKVIRSGKRNLHSLSAGDIVSYSSLIDITGTSLSPVSVLNVNAIEYSDDWNKENSIEPYIDPENEGVWLCYEFGNPVNPYVKGLRGNYKAYKSYAYNKDRNASANDIRVDGQVDIFPFWGLSSGKWYSIYNPLHPNYSIANAESWVLNSQVTKNNPYGNQLESQDALQRFSAAQYGYNNTIAMAEVFNSKYTNFGFDGFEDYSYYKDPCAIGHFRWPNNNLNVTSTESHTGRYSYKIPPYSIETKEVDIKPFGTTPAPTPKAVPYLIDNDEYNGVFSPEAGKKYVLSAWLKEQNVAPEILVYLNTNLTLIGTSAVVTTLTTKNSNIIDGWQKVEIIFEISASASIFPIEDKLTVKIDNSGSEDVFLDDIRIQPFNSTMNSYVYDPISLRLWAELDDRNFATFYEYDEEGTLVRVKKETSRGIKTIQENRAGVKK